MVERRSCGSTSRALWPWRFSLQFDGDGPNIGRPGIVDRVGLGRTPYHARRDLGLSCAAIRASEARLHWRQDVPHAVGMGMFGRALSGRHVHLEDAHPLVLEQDRVDVWGDLDSVIACGGGHVFGSFVLIKIGYVRPAPPPATLRVVQQKPPNPA